MGFFTSFPICVVMGFNTLFPRKANVKSVCFSIIIYSSRVRQSSSQFSISLLPPPPQLESWGKIDFLRTHFEAEKPSARARWSCSLLTFNYFSAFGWWRKFSTSWNWLSKHSENLLRASIFYFRAFIKCL